MGAFCVGGCDDGDGAKATTVSGRRRQQGGRVAAAARLRPPRRTPAAADEDAWASIAWWCDEGEGGGRACGCLGNETGSGARARERSFLRGRELTCGAIEGLREAGVVRGFVVSLDVWRPGERGVRGREKRKGGEGEPSPSSLASRTPPSAFKAIN
jgi:hypothetical protein